MAIPRKAFWEQVFFYSLLPLFYLFAALSFKGDIAVKADYTFTIDSMVNLEVFYEFPVSSLIFLKDSVGFKATYYCALFSLPEKKLLKTLRQEIWLKDYAETRDEKRMVRDRLVFRLPDYYSQFLLLFEDKNSDRTSSAQFSLKERPGLFLMKGKSVSFEEEFSWEDTIAFYRPTGRPQFDFLLVSLKKGRRVVFTCSLPPFVGVVSVGPFSQIPSILSDTSAYYQLSATYYEKGKLIGKKEWMIFIRVSQFLSDKEWEKKVLALIPIAQEAELKKLLGTPLEMRRAAWEKFWEGKEEKEEDYFKRVDYCLKNFSRGDKGLASDRAKIYLKYGAPDAIEEYPYETNKKPYIIWRYYNLGLTFVFVDVKGIGEYLLMEEEK